MKRDQRLSIHIYTEKQYKTNLHMHKTHNYPPYQPTSSHSHTERRLIHTEKILLKDLICCCPYVFKNK